MPSWINYRWAHPVTKKLTPKTTYVVHVGNYFVGVDASKQ